MSNPYKDKANELVIDKQSVIYQYLLSDHFAAKNSRDNDFVFCPRFMLISWNPDDVKNRYCSGCLMYFDQKVQS